MPTATRTLPRLVGVLLLLAVAYVGLQLYPSELPSAADSRRGDLLATVLYDHAIVFVLRVVVICAAVFTVLSIVARIKEREWLTKAGPFEVERAAPLIERERDDLKAQLAALRAEYVRLTEAMLALRPSSPSHDDDPPGEETSHATHRG